MWGKRKFGKSSSIIKRTEVKDILKRESKAQAEGK
jgi:hypothetical protein